MHYIKHKTFAYIRKNQIKSYNILMFHMILRTMNLYYENVLQYNVLDLNFSFISYILII